MDLSSLKGIGLSGGEIKVYLDILEKGPASAGEIIKGTNLQSSSVYHIFDSLLNKGIISFEIKNNRKYFYSVSPERLLDFLDEKKKNLEKEKEIVEKLLPKLQNIHKKIGESSQETLIFEGWRGVYSAVKEAYKQLKPGTTTYAYTLTSELGGADPNQVSIFVDKIIKLREEMNKNLKKKITMKVIAQDNSDAGKTQAKAKNTSVRFISGKYSNPAVINIYGEVTVILLWLKTPLAFYIVSKEVSESFKNNFDLLWNIAKS